MSTEESSNSATSQDETLVWLKVLDHGELPQGRVKPVTCQHQTLCITHYEGQYGALDNRCPHQGGPLGEGSIENGLLRCPWHGWEYNVKTGVSVNNPSACVASYPVVVEGDEVKVDL